MQYIYLHGFASAPQSRKAQNLQGRFQALGHTLHIPDLNQGSFTQLTLSRQIQQVQAEYLASGQHTVIIGSSFGGLTAAWLGQKYDCVERVILLAPAFQFLANWRPKIPVANWQQWEQTGSMNIYHYGAKTMLPLDYGFATDMVQYDEGTLMRSLPTLIIHGINDEVVPIQVSRSYAKQRDYVSLLEVHSDHSLGDQLDAIWRETVRFLEL
ncbi:MAG: YqiA/YcfP family alpha/beta fold hydrolase [Cyanobacteria bacterium P01_F01_bin.150]